MRNACAKLRFLAKSEIGVSTSPETIAPISGCRSFEDVLKTFQEAKDKLAEILSAFEFFDAGSKDVVKQNLKLTNPIGDFPFYVVIETSGSNSTHDEEKLSSFLNEAMNSGLVEDGTVATEWTKIKVSLNPKQVRPHPVHRVQSLVGRNLCLLL